MDLRAIPTKKRIGGGRNHKIEPAQRGHVILPFKEQCPLTKNKGKLKSQDLNAHELFNLFTANIIKTNTIFSR